MAFFVALVFQCSCHREEVQVHSQDPNGNLFLNEHPTYSLISVSDGLGDGDNNHSKFIIKYRKPGDGAVHTEVWHYKSTGYLQWELVRKEPLD